MGFYIKMFGNDIIYLSELVNKGFDYYLSNCNFIVESNRSEIQEFEDINIHNFFKRNHVDMNLSNNTASKIKSFRYILFFYNSRTWIIKYRIITIQKTRQVRFYEIPQCKYKYSGYVNDVIEIINALKNVEFVKFAFCEFLLDVFNKTKYKNEIHRCNIMDEFYYDISSNNLKYKSGRFLSKRYINQVIHNCDISFSISNTIDIAESSNLRKEWCDGMLLKGDHVRVSSERKFNNFINYANSIYADEIMVISLRYKGKLVMQQFLIDDKSLFCESIFYVHIWDYGSDVILKRIIHNLTDIRKYLSWLFLKGSDRKIFFGVAQNKDLRKHKEMICDGFVKYYIM